MSLKPSRHGGSTQEKRKQPSHPSDSRDDAAKQKRSKLFAARAIPAQTTEAALKDGELDLQAFVAAHEFEIRSLEQSMATSKTFGASRAFQKLPRGLRRRTASHNPKRVPRKLRSRARKEISEGATPVVEARRRKPRTTRARVRAERARKLLVLATKKRRKRLKKQMEDGEKAQVADEGSRTVVGRAPRPKIRRNLLNEPSKPSAKFRRRQINKTWLPTHTWHAKRARMTDPQNPLWRFAIALTPNEKIYRPTHRAQGDRGAVVWDMSYMSTIGLNGKPPGMERVLRKLGVTQDHYWGEKGRKWRLGTRAWAGSLSRGNEGKRKRQIGPAMIIWNPSTASDENEEQSNVQRQVFIRIHPSIFLETWEALLSLTRQENPRLFIEDLRFEIGTIELTGPASTECLLDIITPYNKEGTLIQHAELFRKLQGVSNPASLPANAILGFNVQDPRLRYPPRKPTNNGRGIAPDLVETLAAWPAEEKQHQYSLFSRDARHIASQLPSQKSIGKRRSAIAPGTALRPADADPPIPLVLVASRSGTGTQTQGTWTLLLPWKCVLPFWYSLVHCPLTSGGNPRFGGLNESMQVQFERGLPWFPRDFIGMDAGAAWETDLRKKRRWEWNRRPKSKRTEWSTVNLGDGRKGEVGDGLACDFEHIFTLPKEISEAENSTQAETPKSTANTESASKENTSSKQTAKRQTTSLQLLHHTPKSVFQQYISPLPPPMPAHSVMIVRVTLPNRGIVTPCARIYRLPFKPSPQVTSHGTIVPSTLPPPSALSSALRSQWLSRLSSPITPKKAPKAQKRPTSLQERKQRLAQSLLQPPPTTDQAAADAGAHPMIPDEADLIGFVTTGSFCLSEGRGAAVGNVAVDKVVQDIKENGVKEGRICIVRNAGEKVGWIGRWEAL